MQRYLDTPTEFKFSGDSGRFTGYASVIGNVDQGGDVILPGAYREFAKTRDGKVLVLYQHNSQAPVGKARVQEDSRGLHVDGELVLDDPTAQRAYTHMKAGLLDAMSIGYDVLPGGQTIKDGRRELTALKIYEVSLVTFGMNDQARIEVVKSAMSCQHPRELEELLRESLALSGRKAKAGANALWPILRGSASEDDDDPKAAASVTRIAAALKRTHEILSKGF